MRARDEERYGYIGIFLSEFHRGDRIVEHAALVLSKPIESLCKVGSKAIFDVHRPLTVDRGWLVSPRKCIVLVDQWGTVRTSKGKIATVKSNLGEQSSRFD